MAAVSSPQRLPQADPNNLPKGIYLWSIDEAQSLRLSNLLNCDFSTLGVSGTYVVGPQIKCHGCGKLSGLDDFVSGAFKLGIHSAKFMIDALMNGTENKTPAHKLSCCICGTTFLERNSVIPRQESTWLELAKQVLYGIASAGWNLADPKAKAMRGWGAGTGWSWARLTDDAAVGEKTAMRGWATGTGFDWKRLADDATVGKTAAMRGWATGSGFDWKRLVDEVAVDEKAAMRG
ncbi:hypothetical protein FRB93_008051 [Tulasnella sp. JGI-2019a]|nr:hypothetical protein FRB93_008051 [Tulasnella sp. JGI-2019a]